MDKPAFKQLQAQLVKRLPVESLRATGGCTLEIHRQVLKGRLRGQRADASTGHAEAFAADSCSDLLVFLLDMNNAPFVIDSVFISLSLIKGAYHIGRMENMKYDEKADCYYCKNGQVLTVQYEKREKTASGYRRIVTVYRSSGCGGCPFKTDCIKGNNCKTPMEDRQKVLYVSKKMKEERQETIKRITSDYGTQLRMNRSIQAEEKYKRAADATWDAIQAASGAGHELYIASTTSNAYPEPTNLTERTLRMTFMDSENYKEVIFPETRKAGAYGIQRKSIPFFPRGSWNGIAPTITMLDRFYTVNGLPIDEDPEFNTNNKLDIVTIPEGTTYAEPGKRTLYMNMNREPRFYAWVAFENGYYECRTDDKRYAYHKFWGAERSEGDKWLTGFLATENCGVRADDGKIVTAARSQNYSKTGYLNKKGVHPGIQATVGTPGPTVEYPWPVIRLAELYLNYAEACVGYGKEGYPEKGMAYLDKVRERAGLKPVLESWANAKVPLTSYDGQCGPDGRVMKIVRQERMIELYQENHNFWDIRRWKMGETYFNVKARGLNILAETMEDFAKIVEIQDKRTFDAPRQYLMPIPAGEVSKNPNMVQNPGY